MISARNLWFTFEPEFSLWSPVEWFLSQMNQELRFTCICKYFGWSSTWFCYSNATYLIIVFTDFVLMLCYGTHSWAMVLGRCGSLCSLQSLLMEQLKEVGLSHWRSFANIIIVVRSWSSRWLFASNYVVFFPETLAGRLPTSYQHLVCV